MTLKGFKILVENSQIGLIEDLEVDENSTFNLTS